MNRRIFLFCLLATASATGLSQKSSDWVPSKTKAIDIAVRADRAILGLKDTYGEAIFNCDFKPGKGQVTLYNRIRDRKNFRVELARVLDNVRDPLSTQSFLGYNGKYAYFSRETSYRQIPAGKDASLLVTQKGLVQAWPRQFSQLMFTTLITGKGAFTDYVKALQSPASGFQVEVDSRVMQGNNRTFKQSRILAIRTPAVAKKLGAQSIELVFDDLRGVPLQIRSTERNLKGVRSNFQWTCWWKGPMRFKDDYFKIPAGARLTQSGPTPGTPRRPASS
jgi:hypothetical protein